MVYRALMIRTMRTADAPAVSAAFREHDRTPFPRRLGILRRTLFHYHGLYTHLIEAERDFMPDLTALHRDPQFTTVDRQVAPYLRPYDPERPSMRQARADVFYSWEAR